MPGPQDINTLNLKVTTDGVEDAGRTINRLDGSLRKLLEPLGKLEKLNIFANLREDGQLAAKDLKAVGVIVDQFGNKLSVTATKANALGTEYKITTKTIVSATKDSVKAEQDRIAAIEAMGRRAREAHKQEWESLQKLTQASRASAVAPHVTALGNELGGFKGNFTNAGILAIDRANRNIMDIMSKSNIGTDRMQEIFRAVRGKDRSVLNVLGGDEQKLSIGLMRLSAAFDQASDAGLRTQNILIGLHGMIRLLQVQQLHGIISSLQNYFQQADEASLKLIGRIAEIQTISQKAQLTTLQWRDALVQLSNSYGLDVLDVAKAGYEAISNQIAQGAAITPFLAQSFEFARATASTAAESVDLLSAALNGYGLKTESTQRVSAILFKTIELGRVRASELAQTLGNSTPIANSLGISLEELGAGIATLTIQGVRPHTALTLMNNIMLKLLKPTKDMKQLLDEWGVASGEAAIRAFGFAGVLQRLDKEFQSGGLGHIAELAGDMRAIRAEAGLLAGGSFDKFTETLDEMTKGQLQYNEAVKITAESINTKLAKEYQKMNNLFVGNVGLRKNELFLNAIQNLGGLDKLLEGFGNAMISTMKTALTFGVVMGHIALGLDNIGLGFGRLLPVILTALPAFSFLTRVVSPIADKLFLANVALGKIVGNTVTGLPMFAKLGQQLNIIELNASKTALQFTGLGVAIGNVALYGIPIAIAAWSYYAAAVEEAERKAASAGSDFLSSISETSLEISKQIQVTNEKLSESFTKNLKENLKTLNLYYSVFTSRLNSFAKEANSVTSKFAIEDFENSLIGKTALQRLDMLHSRFKEIGTSVEIRMLGRDFEGASKAVERLLEVSKQYRQEQEKIYETVTKVTDKLKEQSADKAFEYSIFNKSPRRQFLATSGRAEDTKMEALTAFKAGDLEKADKLIERAIEIREKAQNIAESISTKKGFGRPKGLEDYQEFLKLRLDINDQILKQSKQERMVEVDKLIGSPKLMSMEGAAREWHTSINTMIDDLRSLETRIQAVNTEGDKLKNLLKEAASGKAAREEGLKSSLEQYGKNLVEFTGRAAETNNKVLSSFNYTPNIAYQFSNQGKNLKEAFDLQQKIRDAQVEFTRISGDKTLGVQQRLDLQLEQAKSTNILIEQLYANYIKMDKLAKEFGQTSPLTIETGTGINKAKFSARFQEVLKSGFGVAEADERLQTHLETITKLNAAQEASNAQYEEAVKELNGLLKENLPNAFKDATETIKASKDPIQQILDSIKKTTQELRDELKLVVPKLKDAPEGKALGGLLGFAGGGWINGMGGRDNLLVRAHRGEFIVNAESAAQFRPQLTAMNSLGANPATYNSGGPITNVGDIHINAELTGQTDIDVVDLGKRLRREIKRGTVRLT